MGVRAGKEVKRPAVFLDRDGTIIHQVELLHKSSEVKIFSSAAPAIKMMNRMGYLVVIVTNQPVVARGIVTPHGVDRVHAVLVDRLRKKGAVVDAIYFCPHHPNANIKNTAWFVVVENPTLG